MHKKREPRRITSQATHCIQSIAILGTTMALTGLAGADIITARFDAVSPATNIT